MQKSLIELPISQQPTDAELKKLKEYFKEMPVGEILTGLKFAKNRWSAKDAGTLKVGRKSIIQKEVHSVTTEQDSVEIEKLENDDRKLSKKRI